MNQKRRGFTLVEVVLALGLCTFGLVALLSLLPVSLDSAREAMDISRASKSVQQFSTELSQSEFSTIKGKIGQTLEKTFDSSGLPTSKASDIYFTITAAVAAATPLPGGSPSDSLIRVSFLVKTPRETLPLKTAITIADMGY